MKKYWIVSILFWITLFSVYAYHYTQKPGTPIGVVHYDPAKP